METLGKEKGLNSKNEWLKLPVMLKNEGSYYYNLY